MIHQKVIEWFISLLLEGSDLQGITESFAIPYWEYIVYRFLQISVFF